MISTFYAPVFLNLLYYLLMKMKVCTPFTLVNLPVLIM